MYHESAERWTEPGYNCTLGEWEWYGARCATNVPISRAERGVLLNIYHEYYSIHLPPLPHRHHFHQSAHVCIYQLLRSGKREREKNAKKSCVALAHCHTHTQIVNLRFELYLESHTDYFASLLFSHFILFLLPSAHAHDNCGAFNRQWEWKHVLVLCAWLIQLDPDMDRLTMCLCLQTSHVHRTYPRCLQLDWHECELSIWKFRRCRSRLNCHHSFFFVRWWLRC